MAPSASKQKRLAEKAAKNSNSGTTASTPAGGSTNGNNTPLTSLSANGSQENLADAHEEMRKLNLATDRSAVSPHHALVSSRGSRVLMEEGGLERGVGVGSEREGYQD